MNKKYERYIEYIVSDLEAPYFKNMRDQYGLSEKEYELVLNKLFDQPVTIKDGGIYDNQGNEIYHEYSDGYWEKSEYDTNGNKIYFEDSNGFWVKYEYNTNGNEIYFEDSNGYIDDRR